MINYPKQFLQNTRDDILSILKSGLSVVEPKLLVKKSLQKLKNNSPELYFSFFNDETPIVLVGAGKAVFSMAEGLKEFIKTTNITGTLIGTIVKNSPFSEVSFLTGGHPLPNAQGITAVKRMQNVINNSSYDTKIIALISGGASSLMSFPEKPLSLNDLRKLYNILINSNLTIQEINIIRAQCSVMAGGGLLKLAYPRKILSLILSDVVGDNLQSIGSGATVLPDENVLPENALSIMKKTKLFPIIPQSVIDFLQQRKRTLNMQNRYSNSRNILIGSNKIALKEMIKCSTKLGYKTELLDNLEKGEVSQLVKNHFSALKKIMGQSNINKQPQMLISGGEGTLSVKGLGTGGRNQHFVLEMVPLIDGLPVIVASIGSDGIDGNSPAAGAIADGRTMHRAELANLVWKEYAENFNSFSFFNSLQDIIITGRTGTNVMDFRLMAICQL